MNDLALPTEIWEVILENLSHFDILLASKVCRQWESIVKRICRYRCNSVIPDRLLLELLEDVETSNYEESDSHSEDVLTNNSGRTKLTDAAVDWLRVYGLFCQSQIDVEEDRCSVIKKENDVNYITTAGPYLVVAHVSENGDTSRLKVYSNGNGDALPSRPDFVLFEADLSQAHSCLISGRVQKVSLLTLPDPVLVICASKSVAFYRIGRRRLMRPLAASRNLKADFRICTEENLILSSRPENNLSISLYLATLDASKKFVSLDKLEKIITDSSPFFWNLFKRHIIVVEAGGRVSVYQTGPLQKDDDHECPSTWVKINKIDQSDMWKDLRYPNPTYFYRGIILSSTLTARTLLGYWHMYREWDYWLVGELVSSVKENPSTEEKSYEINTKLQRVYIGTFLKQEIISLHCQRGYVFCGTSQGALLIFKLYQENARGCISWKVLESKPLMTIQIFEKTINKIASLFRSSDILVLAASLGGACCFISLPLSLRA